MTPDRTWRSSKGSIIPCSSAIFLIHLSDLIAIHSPPEEEGENERENDTQKDRRDDREMEREVVASIRNVAGQAAERDAQRDEHPDQRDHQPDDDEDLAHGLPREFNPRKEVTQFELRGLGCVGPVRGVLLDR